eukprot:scaffold14268_cov156-Amphora_coffeaeformis.AAC.1
MSSPSSLLPTLPRLPLTKPSPPPACNPSSWHPAGAPPLRPTTTPSLAKLQPVDGVSPSSTPTSGAATSTGSATAMPSRQLPPIRDPATNSVAGPRNSSCTIGPQSIGPQP